MILFKFRILIFSISLLSGSIISCAQVSNTLPWTWMKGDNTTNDYGIYGTQGVAASTNKPGAREGCDMSWTDTSGNLWLFGDYGYNASSQGYLSDLWKYDPVANQWTWVNGDNTLNSVAVYGTKGVATSTNNPGARHVSETWTDNSGNLWLFGGTNSSGNLNDLWKYNIAANQWTWMSGDNTLNNYGVYGTPGVAAASNKPGARSRASRPDSRADASGNLWLFGGIGYSAGNIGCLNDLWKYNIASNQWTWVSGDNTADVAGVYGTIGVAASANKPGARDGGLSWIDSSGKFWLYGGGYSPGGGWTYKLSDLWKYDPVTNMWTWMKGDNTTQNYGVYGSLGVTAAANNPGGRLMSYCWIDNYNNFWLWGGYGLSATSTGSATGDQGLNDLWKYDPLTNNWTWMKGDNTPGAANVYGTQGVTAATNKPGNRSGGDQWKDGKGNLWMFGGIDWVVSGPWKNDLWKLLIPQPVAKGNLVSCQTLPTVTIDATNNNTWVSIFDNIGNIAAELNANGNNLGVVSTSLFTKTGACRQDGTDRIYLNRNITITPQTQPSSGTVSVRLYILKAELDSLKTALNSLGQPSGVATISDVDVFKNSDACATVGTINALPLSATTGTYNADYYLQVSISSFSSFYFANKLLAAILPVKISSFTGKRAGTANILQWTASCNGPLSFGIERSADGIHFENIATIGATAADCNAPFGFTDHDPLALNNYYRLSIDEASGTTGYSPVILLQGDKGAVLQLAVMPDLVRGPVMNIVAAAENAERIELSITDITGRLMWRQQLGVQAGSNHLSVNTRNLAPGMYWLYALGEEGRSNVVRFVKQ